mgnify:CR=1 FL=1
MKLKYKEVFIYLFSILLLLSFILFSTNYLINKNTEIINFIDSEINDDFEIEITNNLDNINIFLKDYLFIESHLLKKKKNEINIQINLKKPFAKNNLTKEVIFVDNTIAPFNYFKPNYLDNINLIDVSQKSIQINKYLNDYYKSLSSLFEIDQIEYIENRRYNLVLSNGRKVMLPKVIDSKLLYFIKNNIDLIELNLEEYPSGGKKITLLNKDNTTERLKDLTKKEKNEIKKTINMKKKEKKKLTKQNIARVEENIDQKKSKSKKTKKLLKEIDNKKVNRNSMQVVDVCTILEKCNIEEISKYLLEQGRKKNFPDITIRQ